MLADSDSDEFLLAYDPLNRRHFPQFEGDIIVQGCCCSQTRGIRKAELFCPLEICKQWVVGVMSIGYGNVSNSALYSESPRVTVVSSSHQEDEFDLDKLLAESRPFDYLEAERNQKILDDYYLQHKPIDWSLFNALTSPRPVEALVFCAKGRPTKRKKTVLDTPGSEATAEKSPFVDKRFPYASCPSRPAVIRKRLTAS